MKKIAVLFFAVCLSHLAHAKISTINISSGSVLMDVHIAQVEQGSSSNVRQLLRVDCNQGNNEGGDLVISLTSGQSITVLDVNSDTFNFNCTAGN